jgi:hypothetical protein
MSRLRLLLLLPVILLAGFSGRANSIVACSCEYCNTHVGNCIAEGKFWTCEKYFQTHCLL